MVRLILETRWYLDVHIGLSHSSISQNIFIEIIMKLTDILINLGWQFSNTDEAENHKIKFGFETRVF